MPFDLCNTVVAVCIKITPKNKGGRPMSEKTPMLRLCDVGKHTYALFFGKKKAQGFHSMGLNYINQNRE
jgi:hypothetical protein